MFGRTESSYKNEVREQMLFSVILYPKLFIAVANCAPFRAI